MESQPSEAPAVPQQQDSGTGTSKLSALEKGVIRIQISDVSKYTILLSIASVKLVSISEDTKDEMLISLAKEIDQANDKTIEVVGKIMDYIGEPEPKAPNKTRKRKSPGDGEEEKESEDDGGEQAKPPKCASQ